MIEDTISHSIKFLEETQTSLVNLETELDRYKRNMKIDEIITDKEREITPSDLIKVIEKFVQQHPDWTISVDAPNSVGYAKCKDIHSIYEGMGDTIAIDAE